MSKVAKILFSHHVLLKFDLQFAVDNIDLTWDYNTRIVLFWEKKSQFQGR